MMDIDSETKADLMNKLQAPLSLLEALTQGKTIPKDFLKTALKDLKTAIQLISGDR